MDWLEPDIQLLRQDGRMTHWRTMYEMDLGDTGFVANVGPVVYSDEKDSDPEFY